MSLKIVALLAAAAGSLGIAFGYFLRWIVSLGKKGSMELEIKQMVLDAKERAQKIVAEGEERALLMSGDLERTLKTRVG